MVNQPKPASQEAFRHQLKRHGLKATRQRLAVHEAMSKLVHASADDVASEIAASSDVKITTASVYNILSTLADLKIYGRRLGMGNRMFFDAVTTRHFHMYDRENDVYRDIFDDELADRIQSHLKRRRFKGYTVEDLDIQFIVRPTRKSKNA